LAEGIRDRCQLGFADRATALAQGRTVEVQADVPSGDRWLRCDGERIEMIRSACGSIRHPAADRQTGSFERTTAADDSFGAVTATRRTEQEYDSDSG
jgi:hypothetical protein